MRHEEGTFAGERGLTLFWQCWLPEDAPRATLVVAHGYAEHSGRYMNLVNFFVPKGYAIYALDHRGHGRSEGERVEIEEYDDYLKDLKTFWDLMRSRQPAGKAFLVGHSMGGGIATAYTVLHQDEMDGLVVSGSGIATPAGMQESEPPRTRPADVALADTLSRDPQVAEDYRNDPLVYLGPRSDRSMAAMRGVAARTAEGARSIRIPLLVMVGEASPLGEAPRGQMLHDAVASSDKRIHRYPELLHEIFNEPEHREVMGDMERWLEEHL
ncbi:MAG: lysophospholipase [Dehalococcoidia bacterium]